MSATAKQPVSVLVVIHTADLQVLVMERAGGADMWQSVTGSREGEEALIETAIREVAEETGITITAGALTDWQLSNRFPILARWRGRYAPGVTHNTEHVFSLQVADGTPIRLAPDEHTDYRWLPWADAAARVFSWTNRDAIRLLARRLSAPWPLQSPS